MPTRLTLLLVAVSLTWPGGAAAAELPPDARPEAGRPRATSYVSLVKRPSGDRSLLISYPWKLHRRPSVEVRLVTGKDGPASAVRPLWFVAEHMKGPVKVTLYDCEDKAAGGPVRESLEDKKVEFDVVGGRNSLGKPAVCVVHRLAPEEPAPGKPAPGKPASDGAGPGKPPSEEAPLDATAVYCLLPAWAINQRLLSLDLPRSDFARPGKIHVWFLREEKVLWSETLDWPGHAKWETTEQE